MSRKYTNRTSFFPTSRQREHKVKPQAGRNPNVFNCPDETTSHSLAHCLVVALQQFRAPPAGGRPAGRLRVYEECWQPRACALASLH